MKWVSGHVMCVMVNAVRAQSCGCMQSVHGGRLRIEQHSVTSVKKTLLNEKKLQIICCRNFSIRESTHKQRKPALYKKSCCHAFDGCTAEVVRGRLRT